MDTQDTNCACKLELNADITGIGVRLALYIQILLGWVMSLFWRDTFVENSRAAYMTALALLIASFIELTTNKEISLLDGLVVSFITTMMITYAIASYSRTPPTTSGGGERSESADEKRSITRWLMQFCFVIFWGRGALICGAIPPTLHSKTMRPTAIPTTRSQSSCLSKCTLQIQLCGMRRLP
ncbi:hypothetical protein B0J17DRAFT_157474 [Rhizoctonia solani]|nr:hypothetical protein B0J17DRAFT_157474 [Rhizoctonia solani]